MRRRLLAVILVVCIAGLSTATALPARVFASGTVSALSQFDPVKVALIDTGIRVDRLPAGSTVEPGVNYAFPDKDTTDMVGHGTRIAGIILEIAPDVTLVPLVYYSQYPSGVPQNGGIAAICKGIYDAIDVYGCRIINVSSGVSVDDPELREAVRYAEERGAIVVSAVGNDRITGPDRVFYPAGYDTVVGVGAVDTSPAGVHAIDVADAVVNAAHLDNAGANPRDVHDVDMKITIAPFSQVNDSVTVVAPGKDLEVLSIKGGSKTETVSGTSYATAYISAYAALLASSHPNLAPAEFRDIIRICAMDLGEPGYDETYGWGYLDPIASLLPISYDRLLRVIDLPFSDVSFFNWFCDPILTMYETGLMRGTSETAFDPEGLTTWEMIATMLQRFHLRFVMGENAADDGERSTDSTIGVDSAAIGSDDLTPGNGDSAPGADESPIHIGDSATGWALDAGIFGVPQSFDPAAPAKPISREEVTVVLVKYCEYAGITLDSMSNSGDAVGESASSEDFSQVLSLPKDVSQASTLPEDVPLVSILPVSFTDIEQVNSWAVSYIVAAHAAGLVSGDGNGMFRPKDSVSRAEIATLFGRLIGFVGGIEEQAE